MKTRPYSQKRILDDYTRVHFEYISIQIYSRWKEKKIRFFEEQFQNAG